MQPSIGNLLRELTRLYTQALREHVTSGHDTSSTQNHVLMELGRAGLLTQQELGRRLSLDKGWISRAVESLVQAGLVTKSRHDNDRRSRWLELTAKGKKHYQALNESLDAHAEQLLQRLTSDQRQQVQQTLALLIAGMQTDEIDHTDATAAIVAATIEAAAERTPEVVQVPAAEADSSAEEVAAADGTASAVDTEAKAQGNHEQELATVASEQHEAAAASPGAASDSETSTPRSPAHSLADKARPPMPVAHTRIVGSKTLPTRPLLTRTTLRPPLMRNAQAGEDRPASEEHPRPTPAAAHEFPPRGPAPRFTLDAAPARHAEPMAPRHAELPQQRPPQTARPAVSAQTPMARAAAAVEKPMPAQQDGQRSGSLFHKLLSQGSLFNKLLQRPEQQEQELVEQPEPVETLPDDGILFQAASPTDWNEIRNLLTANRLPVQGALNHLMNFVVATENGRVVGTVGMEVYGDIGLIRSLVVASNMRGKAVAKRLLHALIERAEAKQIGALYLLSGPVDDLFFANGFEKMARADMPTKLYVSTEMQGNGSNSTIALRLIL